MRNDRSLQIEEAQLAGQREAALVKRVKELEAKVTELEARLSATESFVDLDQRVGWPKWPVECTQVELSR